MLEVLRVEDVSSSGRVGMGRVPWLKTLTSGLARASAATASPPPLPRLRELGLRNTGICAADWRELVSCSSCWGRGLEVLDVGNASEALVYDLNALGWEAMRHLRRTQQQQQLVASAPPVWPCLRRLSLVGLRLSQYGLQQLASALAHGAAPALRCLDLRAVHTGGTNTATATQQPAAAAAADG